MGKVNIECLRARTGPEPLHSSRTRGHWWSRGWRVAKTESSPISLSLVCGEGSRHRDGSAPPEAGTAGRRELKLRGSFPQTPAPGALGENRCFSAAEGLRVEKQQGESGAWERGGEAERNDGGGSTNRKGGTVGQQQSSPAPQPGLCPHSPAMAH